MLLDADFDVDSLGVLVSDALWETLDETEVLCEIDVETDCDAESDVDVEALFDAEIVAE